MKRLSAHDDTNTATTNVNITSGSVTGITDITVADGGTGRSTSTTAYGLLAAGTTATGAHQTLAAGATTEILVGGGASALPVWTTAQGSGAPVRATSPSLTTPTLGVATATSVNKVALTAPATAATLTIANNKTLTVNNSITFAGTDATTMTFPSATDTVAGLAATQTITGPWTFGSAGAVGKLKVAGTTSGSTILDASAVASGTLTLPAATDTLVGKATTDTLTNKSISMANNTVTGTTAQFNTAITDNDFATLAGSETLTNKTFNATNNTVSNITGTMMTGTYKVTRQNNTTNTTEATARILTGWGVLVPGATTVANETVTFDTAFSSAPIVTCTFGGDNTSGTLTYGAGTPARNNAYAEAHTITTTNFQARLISALNWGASDSVFYQWIAIGI